LVLVGWARILVVATVAAAALAAVGVELPGAASSGSDDPSADQPRSVLVVHERGVDPHRVRADLQASDLEHAVHENVGITHVVGEPAARATDGERAAWTDRSLEELPYTDPDDPLDDPTRTHLLEEHGDRDDVRALTTYLDDGQTWPLESTEERGHLFRFPSLGYRVCAEASLAVPDAAATLTVTVEASDRERAAGPPAGQHELTIEEPDGTEHRRTLPPGTELTFDDPANGDGRLAFDGDPVVVDRIWDVTARLRGNGPTPAWDGLLCRT